MTIAQLVMRIREKKNWAQNRVAEEVGVDRSTLSKTVNKKGGSIPWEMKLLTFACREGFVEEVLLFLMGGKKSDRKVSTLMWASVLFSDLAPEELKALREVESAAGGKEPLPPETIEFVVKALRAQSRPAISGEGGTGRKANTLP